MNGPGPEGGAVDLPGVLPFEAPAATHAALAALGRTEDIRFSPDNRRIAIAGFTASRILLIDIDLAGGGRPIRLGDVVELSSPDLTEPHGLDFLSDDHLVAANRGGLLSILPLPRAGGRAGAVEVRAATLERGAGFEHLHTPGSVAVVPKGGDRYGIIVCNNYAHHVTRHRLLWGARRAVKKNRIIAAAGLSIPDGVAVSPTRRWIAISNHVTGSVLMYRNGKRLGPDARAAGKLRGAGFPHGVRFADGGRFVLVADAGSPVVRVYLGAARRWGGTRDPVASLRVVTQDAYLRGRHNPEEGGPKGIDIDRRNRVMAVTCHEQPLAFFDLRRTLDGIHAAGMTSRPDGVEPGALAVEPGAGGTGLGADRFDEVPEARRVVHLLEMGDLVRGEVVEDERRRHDQAPREGQVPGRGA